MIINKIRSSGLILLLLGFTMLPTVFVAQTSKGTIAGTVKDVTGALVNDATITALNKSNGETRKTKSIDGEYRIETIPVGIYLLTVTANGLTTVNVENVVVRAAIITSLNVELKAGGGSETIEVKASQKPVESESAELGATLSRTEVTELPINSLNPISLVLTEPGVVSVSGRDSLTNGVDFAVDGLRPRANNFLIDGFDNNDYGIQGQALQPQNVEAIQEVAIQTNSYSAEFGRGGASVTNVIYRSGTNQWHAAAWERYAGTGFNAITSEEHAQGLTTVPRQVENIPGFRVGGPILKNKLFIFGSGQWDKLRGNESGSQLVLPTAAGIATLQSIGANNNVNILLGSLGGAVAPGGQGLFIPIGGRPGCAAPCNVEVGNYIRQASELSDSYEYVIRADYDATDKDTVSVRWLADHNSLTPDLFANPGGLPGTDTEQSGPSRNLGVYWTHVISEHAVNELRVTAQTLNFGFDPLPSTLANPNSQLPEIEVAGLTSLNFGGIVNGFPQDRDHQVFQYQDGFTLTKGHHNFKIGADLTHFGITDGVPFNSRGTLVYNAGGDCTAIGLTGSSGCTALANYIDDFSGNGGQANKAFGVSQISFAQTTQAYYFQDDWKLRPNLAITYGLRYEYFGTPFNALPFPSVNETTALTDSETLRVPEKPDRNNFGPRFGVAYTPNFWRRVFGENKTALRAGWGVFYDTLFANIQDNTASTPPNVTGGTIIGSGGRGLPAFSGTIPAITATLSPTASIDSSVANLRNPITYQWNANVERELPGNWTARVAYVGTRGERLFLNEELNPGVDGVRLNPARGGMLVRSNHGDSIYHGLQAEAEHNFSHGLLFRSAYTWSRSIDNGSEVFTTSGATTRAQNELDTSAQGERGPSAFNRNQRLALTWIYQLPSVTAGSAFTRAASYITRGWQLSGTASFETGAPETVYLGGFDNNGDLSAFNDRPSIGNASVPINYSSACLNATSVACNTGVGYSTDGVTFSDFNNGTVTGPASTFHYTVIAGQNGTLGRNTFYNPGRQDWTMALQREFRMPIKHLEEQSLSLRLEAFNPFNHANLGGGANGVSSVSGNILDTTFLNTAVTSWGGRSIKIYAKYSF